MKIKNPLLFPLLTATLTAIMYCIAFHAERDKTKTLTEKIKKYETDIKSN